MMQHLKRWITSLILLPILLYVLFWCGPRIFLACISLIALLSFVEFFKLNTVFLPDTVEIMLKSSVFFFGIGMIVFAYLEVISGFFILLLGHFIFSAIIWVWNYEKTAENVFRGILFYTIGLIYISGAMVSLIWIRAFPLGGVWVFMLLAIVFSGDIGAYYAGRTFGKHKLCPSVSPNKTIEGAVGGLVMSVLVAMACKIWLLSMVPFSFAIFAGLACGAVGQIGDLFESALKRRANVKDSGTLLPGHGGVLDRIDAVFFAAPVFYVIGRCLLF